MPTDIRGRLRVAALLGSSVGAIFAANPALAQTASTASDAANPGDEIVVTAQFRAQNLQDTPLAITAVTGAMMEAKSQTNLAQVADQAPNVAIRPQGASFGPSVVASIRGAGQNDFNPAYEPGVGIYIDDVYYPQLTGAIFDLLDVDRVEILRGPQGTLTGRNSEGGAIKFYSKKPDGDGSGYIEGTYGSRDRKGLRGAVDFGLTDNLAMRISGVWKEQDGYVKRIDYGCAFPNGGILATTSGDCTLSKLGGVGYKAVRGILHWEPTSAVELTISGDYVRDKRTIAGEVLLNTGAVPAPNTSVGGVTLSNRFLCGKFCNYATIGQPAITWKPALQVAPGVYIDPLGAAGTKLAATSGNDQSDYEGWGTSANLRIDLSENLQLTSITGYRKFDTEFYSDDDLTPINTNFGRNFLKNHSFSQELRLNYEPMDGVNVTVGGYYFDQKSVYDSYQDIRYVSVFPLQFRQPDPTTAKAKAAFGNLGWEITDALTINAGVRYTDESKEQTYFRYNLDGTINRFVDPVGAANGAGYSGPNGTALTGFTARYKADRVDYRAAADYRVSPGLMVYGSIATGFKGGGSNPRPFNAAQVIPFNPEKVTAYEVGFKSDFLDRRVRFNTSAFINDYTDLQIPVSACPDAPCAARLNAGDARVKGIEFELNARPVDGFLLDAALSYLTQKFDARSLNPAATFTGVVIDGSTVGTNPAGVVPSDPPSVPKWKFSAGAQYAIDLGAVGSLTPRLDVAYQSKQYTGPTVIGTTRTLNYLPSFTTANARLTWENVAKDLSASLEVTNLTDKYYYLSRFNLLGAGAGFDKALPAAPREWAITLRKKF